MKTTSLKQPSRNMKTLIRSTIAGLLGLAIMGVTHAATLNFNDAKNVVNTGSSFTFSQFNPTLGTLSAVDLIINSSVPGGSITVTNLDSNPMSVDAIEARFRLSSNATLGLTAYNSVYVALNTSPSSSPFNLGGSSSQSFSVSGGQTLIGGSAVTRSISNSALAQYLGTGTVSFATSVQAQVDTLGSDFSVNSNSFNSNTSMTLRYTYTAAPSGVPERGQVAASVLLLTGIGGYVFIKRRRQPATIA